MSYLARPRIVVRLSLQSILFQVTVMRNISIDSLSNKSSALIPVSSPPVLIFFLLGHDALRRILSRDAS